MLNLEGQKRFGCFLTQPMQMKTQNSTTTSQALRIQKPYCPDKPFFSSKPASDLRVWLLLCRESFESSFSSSTPAKLIFLSYLCRSISGSRRSLQVSRSCSRMQTTQMCQHCEIPLKKPSGRTASDGVYFNHT